MIFGRGSRRGPGDFALAFIILVLLMIYYA